jgi:hypothetical protein
MQHAPEGITPGGVLLVGAQRGGWSIKWLPRSACRSRSWAARRCRRARPCGWGPGTSCPSIRRRSTSPNSSSRRATLRATVSVDAGVSRPAGSTRRPTAGIGAVCISPGPPQDVGIPLGDRRLTTTTPTALQRSRCRSRQPGSGAVPTDPDEPRSWAFGRRNNYGQQRTGIRGAGKVSGSSGPRRPRTNRGRRGAPRRARHPSAGRPGRCHCRWRRTTARQSPG